MGGQRLDRAELRHRLPEVADWIVDDFADAFEPALLAGLKTAADRERKSREPPPRTRARQGRTGASDEGDSA